MSDPFIGEVQIWGLHYTPAGWVHCDGSLLPISDHGAMFVVIGTIYGGNGQTTFAVPNLQGATPMQWGTGPGLSPKVIGESGGANNVALDASELPKHDHNLFGDDQIPESAQPSNDAMMGILVNNADLENAYREAEGSNLKPMSPLALSAAGSGGFHVNMQPYMTLNFCIALTGEFPSRS